MHPASCRSTRDADNNDDLLLLLVIDALLSARARYPLHRLSTKLIHLPSPPPIPPRHFLHHAQGFATSIAIIVSCVVSVWLLAFHVTGPFLAGATLVMVATYLYGQPDRVAATVTGGSATASAVTGVKGADKDGLGLALLAPSPSPPLSSPPPPSPTKSAARLAPSSSPQHHHRHDTDNNHNTSHNSSRDQQLERILVVQHRDDHHHQHPYDPAVNAKR